MLIFSSHGNIQFSKIYLLDKNRIIFHFMYSTDCLLVYASNKSTSSKCFVLDMTSILSDYDVKLLLVIVNLMPAHLSGNFAHFQPNCTFPFICHSWLRIVHPLIKMLPQDKV